MTLLILWILALFRGSNGWYLPGSAPKEYDPNAPVALKVDKLTSSKTQLPYSFYHLPYCQPDRIEDQAENLGEILAGDLIQNTNFDIKMLVEEKCKLLCYKELNEADIDKFINAVDDDYMVNILADNLPAAIVDTTPVFPTEEAKTTFYSAGIPVGIISTAQQHILVNHWNFIIRYHESQNSGIRVVGFEVTPQSIKHQHVTENNITKHTCQSSEHLILENLPKDSATVAFTYSISFLPSAQAWASRWDVYLKDTGGSTDIHWFSIVNALMIVLLLSGIIAMILLRTLLRDIARYNQLDDLEDAQEEFGWKLVHGDVFRRPGHSKLLAVCAGTGVQLLGMCAVTLLFASLGFLSAAYRGSFLQAALLLFAFMGWPAGYVSGRFNKFFEGDDTTRNFVVTCMTALQFPGVCFGVFFILNLVLWSKESSGAVPFSTMFLLLLVWFGISIPLVFAGSFFGYRKQCISVPVRTNQIPRQIPPCHWLLSPVVSHTITGVLPFCAVFTELLFILGSVWQHRFYYLFGFVSLVVIILVITCAEISIAFTYFLLCSENYMWWWRAYWASAASAVYVFLYGAFYFFARLSITKPASVILYFGYTFLMSYAFFLLTGAVGFISTFVFVRAIYGAVKVD